MKTQTKLAMSRYRAGCACLHAGCLLQGGKAGWHLKCIRRELRPMFRVAIVLAILSFCVALWAGGPEAHRESFRPQFHFTPERNWMNDPNGMVFFEGEYHLFYQYNPFGDKWGHMSWGHAVSKDMVHWKHLPVALPEEDGIMIFSGSAVVDWKNTSGFGKNGKPPMVAIYTGRRNSDDLQNQCIAYSNDNGRTWTKYADNPVIDIGSKNFRDPKVFWHEQTQRWVMVVSLSDQRKVRFYKSADLKRWEQSGEFGPAGSVKGIWECPDLFPLEVAGQGETKWVLIVNIGSAAPAGGSGTQYFVGNFDGNTFTADKTAAPVQPQEPKGEVFADFEGDSYSGWKATGDAFGAQPASGTLPNQMAVGGYRGNRLVNSFHKGDGTQGTLTSPEFTIRSKYINFLVGGGAHAGKTCVNLVVDGKVVRTATGAESEALDWHAWSVADLTGKEAVIQVVDAESGGWGHINVDHIVFSDVPTSPAVENALWADYGRDFYAGVSWSDIPDSDGRTLWLGWMSNWQYAQDVPTSPWRSAMSLPRELTLAKTPDGYRMRQHPVRELKQLRSRGANFSGGSIEQMNTWIKHKKISGNTLEIIAEFERGDAEPFGLDVLKDARHKTVFRIEPNRKMLVLDRSASGNTSFHPKFDGLQQAPLSTADNVRLHVFVDACSVEVFADSGQAVITSLVLPPESARQIEFFGSKDVRLKWAEVWSLKSAWSGEGLARK